MVAGLIVTPSLTQRSVASVEMHFEPSMGIMARRVDKLGLDIRSFREPLRRSVRQVVIPSIKENFAVGGRPPWAPLEASTVQQKRGNTQPLVRTGKLRRNMGYMSIWHIDAEKAFIADLPPRIWYGKVHQAGATFSSHSKAFKAVHISYLGRPLGRPDKASSGGVIPARPFVVVQPEDVQAIEEVFERWLEERIVKAGLR